MNQEGETISEATCNTRTKRSEHPNVGGVFIRRRDDGLSRKGMRGQWSNGLRRAKNEYAHPPLAAVQTPRLAVGVKRTPVAVTPCPGAPPPAEGRDFRAGSRAVRLASPFQPVEVPQAVLVPGGGAGKGAGEGGGEGRGCGMSNVMTR